MDDRMERLRAKDPGAAAADAEDDAEDEFDAPPVTDELPLVPPAPQVTTPPPTPPVVTAPRTIPRLPPIRRPGMQAAPTATMTPAVAPQADVKPASRRPAFHPTEIEMREQEERDMREKAEREQRERDAAAVAVRKPGAGRLPTSRRPAFLDNLAEDDLTEIEMREQEERDMREKAEREQRERERDAAAVRKSGPGRLPTSRRPAFLDNLAEDDPLE
jgi:hypothetical protein